MKKIIIIVSLIGSLSVNAQKVVMSVRPINPIDMRLENMGRDRNVTDIFLISGMVFLITCVATQEKSLIVPASVYMGTGFSLRIKSNLNLIKKRNKRK